MNEPMWPKGCTIIRKDHGPSRVCAGFGTWRGNETQSSNIPPCLPLSYYGIFFLSLFSLWPPTLFSPNLSHLHHPALVVRVEANAWEVRRRRLRFPIIAQGYCNPSVLWRQRFQWKNGSAWPLVCSSNRRRQSKKRAILQYIYIYIYKLDIFMNQRETY